MKHSPLYNWILCKRIDPPTQTGTTGLVIPMKAKDNFPYAYARVAAVGPGLFNADGSRQAMTVKEGDVITYPKSRGELMPTDPNDPLNQECLLILNEQMVMTIVEGFPEESSIMGLDGKPLPIDAMDPKSTALPDQVYKNREDAAVAKYYKIPGAEKYVDTFAPGDADDRVTK